jgi:hypothetical protein
MQMGCVLQETLPLPIAENSATQKKVAAAHIDQKYGIKGSRQHIAIKQLSSCARIATEAR